MNWRLANKISFFSSYSSFIHSFGVAVKHFRPNLIDFHREVEELPIAWNCEMAWWWWRHMGRMHSNVLFHHQMIGIECVMSLQRNRYFGDACWKCIPIGFYRCQLNSTAAKDNASGVVRFMLNELFNCLWLDNEQCGTYITHTHQYIQTRRPNKRQIDKQQDTNKSIGCRWRRYFPKKIIHSPWFSNAIDKNSRTQNAHAHIVMRPIDIDRYLVDTVVLKQ